jgi:Glycosyltransferase family 87
VFIVTLVIGNAFLPPEKAVDRAMLGHDFTAFYTAGHFTGLRQFEKLYDIEAVKQFEQETGRRYGLSLGDSYGPYWNPPFYAWVFAPLARLPYPRALAIWTAVNVACLAGAIVLLCRMLVPAGMTPHDAGIGWRSWALVPLLLVCSMPVIQALSHGQNACTSLLLLAVTVTLWRQDRALWAGMLGGLLFYKPQLGAVVAAALVLTMGWRALAGLVITGVVLLSITVITMPGALGIFLHQLPANVRFMQVDHAYVWERHTTIKAFWRLLFQGRGAGAAIRVVSVLWFACAAMLGGGLLAAVVRRGAKNRDRVIAATIVTMPLLMPFYFDYDLMLLAVPAVLLAGEIVGRSESPFSRLACEPRPDAPRASRAPGRGGQARRLNGELGTVWLVRAWVALYAWMLINPGLAAPTHVNLTVPLLTLVAVLSIVQCLKIQAGSERQRRPGSRHAPEESGAAPVAPLAAPPRLASIS